MKKLKKILLINWLYFSKQVIEVGDINFLTGKNGAGKSTVIDALQIVLLGETNARNFNQAANEKSQRTLDGYLRADMDSNNPRSRRGKDFSSYIACEFWDDVNGTQFVSGIVFDCRSDGGRQDRYFIFDGTIPENEFIDKGEAMDIPALRSFLKQKYGTRAKLYDSQKQYRADMLAKWNVHNEQVLRMMKKAVSFRPIVDIQNFITENICDIPDKPDIEAMQQNIRDYKRHEQMAQRQEEKLVALREIGKLYREMQQAMDRWEIQSFLILWAQKETLEGEIQKRSLEKRDCEESILSLETRLEKIVSDIAQKEQRRTELIAACAQSDVSREEDRLCGARKSLIEEQQRKLEQLNRDADELKLEAVRIYKLCDGVLEWEETEPLSKVIEAADAAKKAYAVFTKCDYQIFSKSSAVFERACQAVADLLTVASDASYTLKSTLEELNAEKDKKISVLSNLKKNIKDYPKGLMRLKERLLSELFKRTKKPVQIEILADVLEIPESEEVWRGAVEGYLNTQKFYLLVDPAVYQDALQIYDQIKREFSGSSFGLVDIGKLREKEKLDPWPDSLARKIETESPLARSYIDYLLGRVVCCTHVNQLRRHKTAITADGMLYQGYVARPIRKELMEDAFIGRRAVSLRIERLQMELNQIHADIRKWDPICKGLLNFRDHKTLISDYFVNKVVSQRQADFVRGLEIAGELEEVETQISHLDLFWLNEQRGMIEKLSNDLAQLDKEKIQCSNDKALKREHIHRLTEEILPELNLKLVSMEDQLRDQFTEQFTKQVGIPRYDQELKRLKKASTVYSNFNGRFSQTVKERDDAQKQLFKARYHYVDRFKPCSFAVEVMDNDEYAGEQRALEESELPKFRAKIQAARESAMEQFQNDFLAKLKSSIDQVQDQVKNLNKALKQAQFGTDRYQFRVDRNPDHADYYDMIMAPELMEGDAGLMAMPFQQKYGKLIESLFTQIAMSDDTQNNARKQSELQQNIEKFTDFRTYLKFDLETTDQNGSKQLLSQTLNTKSGGETQTPFYIAVLASFAQLYQVNNLSGLNNTVRLVVFDEAFNKMDSERIVESVRLLRKMGLQAIICTPPDKLSDIMPLADQTHLVIKETYQMHVTSWGKEILQS